MPSDNNHNPKVSVIVPLYNQERRFDACLRSICEQTYSHLEIIVVNDGSTDDSPKIARQWASKDSRIRVVDKKNEGATMARKDGLKLATGEYVTFVDSDDLIPKNAIAILAGHMQDKEVDLVLGSMTRKLGFVKQNYFDAVFTFPIHQVVRQPELFDKYYAGFFHNNVFNVSMCGRLYRKSVIDQAMSDDVLFDKDVTLMGEDQYFNLMLFPYLKGMYRTDETVYIYRYGGATNRFNPNFPQLFVSSDKRLKLLDKYNYTAGYDPLYAEYIACLYFHASRLISCKVADKEGVKDFFKQEIETRELMPRLIDYYTTNGVPGKKEQMLIDKNYEGMYEYACEVLRQRKGSLKAALRSLAIRLLVRLS